MPVGDHGLLLGGSKVGGDGRRGGNRGGSRSRRGKLRRPSGASAGPSLSDRQVGWERRSDRSGANRVTRAVGADREHGGGWSDRMGQGRAANSFTGGIRRNFPTLYHGSTNRNR